ncbi:hypothetical protein Dimus_009627 [Dionaea muscipula]
MCDGLWIYGRGFGGFLTDNSSEHMTVANGAPSATSSLFFLFLLVDPLYCLFLNFIGFLRESSSSFSSSISILFDFHFSPSRVFLDFNFSPLRFCSTFLGFYSIFIYCAG